MAYQEQGLQTCNRLYDTYSSLIPQLTLLMEKNFPKEQDVSLVAYTAAIRAKVLDCLRGLLPAGALTNMAEVSKTGSVFPCESFGPYVTSGLPTFLFSSVCR